MYDRTFLKDLAHEIVTFLKDEPEFREMVGDRSPIRSGKPSLRGHDRMIAKAIVPRLMDIDAAAAYISRSRSAVQKLIFFRKIPVVRVGRRTHLAKDDLDRWIDQNKV